MNARAALFFANSRIEVVEPMWSASRRIRSSHSGCASTSAPGCSALSRSSFRSENVTCTEQTPGQSTMSRPVLLDQVPAQLLVRREEDRPAGGNLPDDPLGVARRADDVAQRLHAGAAVDVADDGVARVRVDEPPRRPARGSRRPASSRPRGRAGARACPGSRIFAVSAMKCTPQNTMTSGVGLRRRLRELRGCRRSRRRCPGCPAPGSSAPGSRLRDRASAARSPRTGRGWAPRPRRERSRPSTQFQPLVSVTSAPASRARAPARPSSPAPGRDSTRAPAPRPFCGRQPPRRRTAPGRMYFWATRCTSAAVTAWMFCT